MSNERIEFAGRDFDSDCLIDRVKSTTVSIAARRVGKRAVGISNRGTESERAGKVGVRVSAHEKLIATIGEPVSVVSGRTQFRIWRVGRKVHAPVRGRRHNRQF